MTSKGSAGAESNTRPSLEIGDLRLVERQRGRAVQNTRHLGSSTRVRCLASQSCPGPPTRTHRPGHAPAQFVCAVFLSTREIFLGGTVRFCHVPATTLDSFAEMLAVLSHQRDMTSSNLNCVSFARRSRSPRACSVRPADFHSALSSLGRRFGVVCRRRRLTTRAHRAAAAFYERGFSTAEEVVTPELAANARVRHATAICL